MHEKQFQIMLAEYEIRSSWWASYISNDYLQSLAGKYFAAKVNRKFKRLKQSRQMKMEIAALTAKP